MISEGVDQKIILDIGRSKGLVLGAGPRLWLLGHPVGHMLRHCPSTEAGFFMVTLHIASVLVLSGAFHLTFQDDLEI